VFSLSSPLPEFSKNQRANYALFWAILTLFMCFLVLFTGVAILGNAGSQDLIVISLYTYIPALMAILFIIYLKTNHLSLEPFRFPGFHWLAFGAYYTFIVLSLTILTGFILGELSPNFNYSPFPAGGELGTSTQNAILDILIYLPYAGVLLIFSPFGLLRVIGEEYGWRGYLLPELLKARPVLSIITGIWIVGAVWFIYHIPFFTIFAPVNDTNQMIFLLIGSAGVFFGANFAMSWAYLKTKNVWPAISLHFVWNLTSPIFTGNIYSSTNQLGFLNTTADNLWLVNGEGLIGGLFHFIVGLIFLYLIYRDKDELLNQYHKFEILENISGVSHSSSKSKLKSRRKEKRKYKNPKGSNSSSKSELKSRRKEKRKYKNQK